MTTTLITLSNPRAPASEAYRTLRTNLDFSNLDKSLHALLVNPDEGKSTTLANLAVTIAQSGKKVILIDCDLRRPTQHQIFNLKNNTGLSDMVRDDEILANPPLQETTVPNLRVLTSGLLPPNPSEILGSKRMSDILAALSQDADILLLDAPPVIAVTDASVLASKVDGVLLVVSAGKTKRDSARKAQAQLQKVGARVIGAVLNNVKADGSSQYDYSEQSG